MSGERCNALIVTYGKHSIPVKVRFIATQRFTITVNPDMSVVATAPEGASAEDVAARLDRKAGWIVKQRAYFEQFKPELPAPRFLSGESLWYLGRQYRLKTVEGWGRAKLIGKFLVVPTSDAKMIEQQVGEWYHDHACAQFSLRLDRCHEQAKALLDVEKPALKVRRMQKRWGSCTARGIIILNTDLVKTPVHCIDYVVVHELCHLQVHRHDKEFYRLLAACMPDWERRKARLETFVK